MRPSAPARSSVDFARRQVFVDGQEVHLTPTEFRILSMLVRHAGKVVTHRQLLKEVWGPDNVWETHTLRVCCKPASPQAGTRPTAPEHLLTEPGVGYRLADRSGE